MIRWVLSPTQKRVCGADVTQLVADVIGLSLEYYYVSSSILQLCFKCMTELILTSNRPYKFILFLTKAVFCNVGFSPYPRRFCKKNATVSPKPHFTTLVNGVRGVFKTPRRQKSLDWAAVIDLHITSLFRGSNGWFRQRVASADIARDQSSS